MVQMINFHLYTTQLNFAIAPISTILMQTVRSNGITSWLLPFILHDLSITSYKIKSSSRGSTFHVFQSQDRSLENRFHFTKNKDSINQNTNMP